MSACVELSGNEKAIVEEMKTSGISMHNINH